MELLVVGAGSMGRWIAQVLAPDALAFVDVDPDAAADAAGTLDGDVLRDLDGGRQDATFDVVCLAVPISAVESAAADHAHRATEAVIDVTGVMGPAVEALREAAPDRARLSLHPLFAPERAPGRVAAVADNPGRATDEVRDRLTAAGNEVFDTTPAEHDRAMETVQAGAHTAVLAYALAADPVRPEFHTPVSGELATLVDRVTTGDADVYAEVQAAFDGADAVADAASRIADADDAAFRELFARAGTATDEGSTERPD